MTATASCRFCGSEELERSEHKGELTCCRCGAVLEESGVVEGLQFAESSGGGMAMAMRRDWITTGRRPMGLCGAALLIAARYHDVQIDAEEVATAVRVSCPTLSKRLYEFKKTAVAQLPASALGETDLLQLPALPLPPCRLAKKRHQQHVMFLAVVAYSASTLRRTVWGSMCLAEREAPLPLGDGPATADAASPVEKAASELPATAGDPRPSPEAPSAADQTSGGGGYDSHTGIIPLASQRVEGSEALCKELPSSGDILSVAGWMVEVISAPSGAAAAASGGDTAVAAAAVADAEEDDGRCRAGSGGSFAGVAAETAECEYAERGDREEEETIRAADSVNPLADLLRSVRARVDELLPTSEVSRITADGGSRHTVPVLLSAAASTAEAAPTAKETAASAASASNAERRGAAVEDEDAGDSDDGLDDMLLTEQEREAKALIWRRPQARRTAALAAAASAAESVRLSLEKRGKGLAQRIDEEALEALFAARRVVEL
ncbi:transcription factor IIIB 90 kDa subunit [Cyclospora cayetanensis]|uniref:Transcription factor IIIB 90 kDa subunit n=1 Tax=Cyclospora cayetanensis TaxID=88456 RepID=A0A6P6RYD9_9EIME|nr:transcription factor IIIB 90 kDa subunit [Cyclospora cayetanensis]